jgi:esterase/lipase
MCRRKAVLIIHGLAGGTYDEEILANYIEVNRSLDVYAFTLPGHEVRDKNRSTCEEWINESENQLLFLLNHGYKKVYLVGHSMGGVIATHLAKKYKEVKKLVLAAPAFTSIASKEEGGLLNAIKSVPDLIKSYSVNEFATRLSKLPFSAEKEFMKLIDTYKDEIYDIKIPVLFLHGTDDQLVPVNSSIKIFDKMDNNKKQLIIINGYHHDIFRGDKVFKICEEVETFLKDWNYDIKVNKKEL